MMMTTHTIQPLSPLSQGASDGGLDIPQSEKRFPGYDRDGKSYSAEDHKERILGQHVADYMNSLTDEDEEAYKKLFAKYIEHGVEADDLEELYAKVSYYYYYQPHDSHTYMGIDLVPPCVVGARGDP